MAFQARVYRVLIASPSDVATERDIAARVIQEWNDANSSDRQVAILPVRWETHTIPEYGSPPQEIINRQIVDDCDFVVGVFWTRIGTPTDKADSGTLEEIERAAADKKPVLLYFSDARQNPDDIDIDQLSRLRAFKNAIQSKAIIEQFKDQVDFGRKLARALDRQIKSLMATQAARASGANHSQRLGADIEICFANSLTGESVGPVQSFQTQLVEFSDIDSVPKLETKERRTGNIGLSLLSSIPQNKDYYRQVLWYYQNRLGFRPIRFWLINRGSLGARDLYIDLSFRSAVPFVVAPVTEIARQPSKTNHGWVGADGPETSLMSDAREHWSAHFELKALQPQRVISPNAELAIAATSSGRIDVEVKIFADLLAAPVQQTLHIEYIVQKGETPAVTLLAAMGELDGYTNGETPTLTGKDLKEGPTAGSTTKTE